MNRRILVGMKLSHAIRLGSVMTRKGTVAMYGTKPGEKGDDFDDACTWGASLIGAGYAAAELDAMESLGYDGVTELYPWEQVMALLGLPTDASMHELYLEVVRRNDGQDGVRNRRDLEWSREEIARWLESEECERRGWNPEVTKTLVSEPVREVVLA